jgi:hypothetical protein
VSAAGQTAAGTIAPVSPAAAQTVTQAADTVDGVLQHTLKP